MRHLLTLFFVSMFFVAFIGSSTFFQTIDAAEPELAKTNSETNFSAKTKPNVLLILIDDLGWTDLGCYGSSFYKTPNIDKLAKQGMQFTNNYAACTVCSPTRACILTGKYPAQLHITDWIPGYQHHIKKRRDPELKGFQLISPQIRDGLAHKETTIAEMLSQKGYTCASIGKWHLGGKGGLGEKSSLPTDHGFHLNVGGTYYGQPPTYHFPYTHKRYGFLGLPSLEEGEKGEYLTDRITEEAIQFITKTSEAKKPFFLYLPHFAVHTPIQAKAELVKQYQKKVAPNSTQQCPQYAAMIHSVDEGIGRIMTLLDEKNLADNTLVIFTSDNGGLKVNKHKGVPMTSNLPLRAGKGSPYEGGTRVPMIVRYPNHIPEGIKTNQSVFSGDIFPTIAQFCKVSCFKPQSVDGVSLVSLLTKQKPLEKRSLYWHYPHYHTGGSIPYSAIRTGDFKLIEFARDQSVELYNLKNDLGETKNIASENPKLVKSMRTELESWRQSQKAQRVTKNKKYNPEKPNRAEFKTFVR